MDLFRARLRKSFSLLFFLLIALPLLGAEFIVQRPPKLNIAREIKKVFIDPELFDDTNDKLNIKNEVVVTLKRRLNDLGRFEAILGPPRGFDPNLETVAIIHGDIISGGEIDQGQITEKAECKGGLSGLIGAAAAGDTSEQGITLSRRGMACKLPNLESSLTEAGVSAGLGLLGVQEYARLDEVIRVYKYKNFSLFAQVNLSFTRIGEVRETLAIQSDTASFSRHVVSPGTYRNVRESGDNAPLIWLWFRVTPVAPVVIRDIGVVSASNPGSALGKWYDRVTPEISDLPEGERMAIIVKLVNKTMEEFIQTISPFKDKLNAEIASGSDARVRDLLERGRFEEVKSLLQNPEKPDDLYNLGLAYEASATGIEDYEDALLFYNQALDKDPGSRLYAGGIGRMEFQLRQANRLKSTGNRDL